MTHLNINPIRTIELAAWGFDEYKPRPDALDREKSASARSLVAQRRQDYSSSALCEEETRLLRDPLELQQRRLDLHAEMVGLDWSLGVVDLRRLLAFQRRLSFNASLPAITVPAQHDWNRLVEIAFASANPVVCDLEHNAEKNTVTLQSSNPNVQLRVTQNPIAPVAVSAGSPFFEVAHYLGRWFLRDGYHRAYKLLCAGIFLLPAVIVRARSFQELGAVKPHFFSEAILFSEQPPFVGDFLDHSLTIEYERHPIIKTLRITMEESIAIPFPTAVSGEQP